MGSNYLSKSYWNGMIKMCLSRLFILRVLYDEPLHGYKISKQIAEMTNDCCSPTEGSLYPALHEFLKEGYLTCHTETVRGRKRKVYTLTEKGIKAYKVGLEAWEETAQSLLNASKELSSEIKKQ